MPNQIYKTPSKANAVRWNGEEILVSQKARELGLDPTTLVWRINNWGIERAMTTRKHTPAEVAAIGKRAFAERRCRAMTIAGQIRSKDMSEVEGKIKAKPIKKRNVTARDIFLMLPAREEGYRHGAFR